jgi:uncharacterized lipoprotein
MKPQRFSKILSLLLFAHLLAGCGVTTDRIKLDYVVRGGRDKAPGAADVKVDVKIADQRSERDVIGRKSDGLGAIVATNDVVELVRHAILTELELRGFARGNEVIVTGELSKFYNRFDSGLWTADSIAEFVLSIQIKGKEGNILFAKSIVAQGLEPNVQLAAGHNAKASMEDALAKAMAQLFQDPAFIPAVFKAADRTTPESR